jgi:hypothetical protein
MSDYLLAVPEGIAPYIPTLQYLVNTTEYIPATNRCISDYVDLFPDTIISKMPTSFADVTSAMVLAQCHSLCAVDLGSCLLGGVVAWALGLDSARNDDCWVDYEECKEFCGNLGVEERT